MFLCFILLIVIFVQLYKYRNSIYENFDGNCIRKLKPSFSFKISDHFQKDQNGQLIINDNGLIEINYASIDIDSLYNNDLGQSALNDVNILLSKPFIDDSFNILYNRQNCKLNYLD